MLDAQRTLKERFGFDEFRPGQREVIESLLSGHSAAAVFPTGSGKSLCYQLPSLLLSGVTVVVSPLIALMKDQIDKLNSLGISAARLDSTLSLDEYTDVMSRLRRRDLKMLYVAPERFSNERFREAMRTVPISLFAVDEAHCISEWGHNFRPDYLKLARYAAAFKVERILALTATATPDVLSDICRVFQIAPEHSVRTGFYRPNLTLLTTEVETCDRLSVLQEKVASRPRGPTIVYVTQQKTAEEVARFLSRGSADARAYHAGMEDDVRAQVQDWFQQSDSGIVVATIAFGMGIDKANIRYVYHFNLPKSLENYSQEIGRAGRDGLPSTCEMLASLEDLNVLENFVFGDTPSRENVEGLVDRLFQLGPEFDVSLYELSATIDIKPIVLKTLLTYLELDGYVEEGTPFYETYQFRPLVPSKEILANFEGERQQFLKSVFLQADQGRTWFKLDISTVSQRLKQPRERIIKALDYCEEKQWLELKVSGVRNRLRRLRMPDDASDLAAELYDRMLAREESELERLGQVVDLIESGSCQVNLLATHFGEFRREPCGHCTTCLEQQREKLAPRQTRNVSDSEWKRIITSARAAAEVLKQPRTLTRFLCGLTSPKLSRAKLSSHELFGFLEDIPFGTVLKRVQSED